MSGKYGADEAVRFGVAGFDGEVTGDNVVGFAGWMSGNVFDLVRNYPCHGGIVV